MRVHGILIISSLCNVLTSGCLDSGVGGAWYVAVNGVGTMKESSSNAIPVTIKPCELFGSDKQIKLDEWNSLHMGIQETESISVDFAMILGIELSSPVGYLGDPKKNVVSTDVSITTKGSGDTYWFEDTPGLIIAGDVLVREIHALERPDEAGVYARANGRLTLFVATPAGEHYSIWSDLTIEAVYRGDLGSQ